MANNNQNNNTQKRGPGRPPGSKNKTGESQTSQSKAKTGKNSKPVSTEQERLDKIRNMQEQYDRERRNVDVIWSITLFAVGLFLFFTVVMDTTGAFGAGVHDICLGLFGIMAYVLPFFVLLFAVLLIARKMRHISARTIIFTLLIFLNMCILNSYRFIDAVMPLFGFHDIAQYYVDGVSGRGGGAIGMEIGSILVKFFGMPGLLIIASAVLLISIFLVANTPISRFFDNLGKKHEQKLIFREMEEAETAKIQRAVASNATPGADPDTGIVSGGVTPEHRDSVVAGSAKSLWRSILNGISKIDEEPDSVPSQQEQYAALRHNNKSAETVVPLEAPAHRVDNLTYESELEYTSVLSKDTLLDKMIKRVTGSFRPADRNTLDRPVSVDMNYDDVDTGEFGYPGRRTPASDTSSASSQTAASKEVSRGLDGDFAYKSRTEGKHYGLGDPDEFGHSGAYGLDGRPRNSTKASTSDSPMQSVGYAGGNAAGMGLAANMRSASTTEHGLDGSYDKANAHRKKISGTDNASHQGLGDAEKVTAEPVRSKKKGLETDHTERERTAEDNALAESFAAESEDTAYVLPPVNLLKKSTGSKQMMSDYQLEQKADLLEKTLNDFGVDAKVLTVTQGASVTRYEVQPATGVKVSSITRLADDIALNLRAKTIRIEAPIPGKAAVGIEVENDKPSPVLIRELIESAEFEQAESKITFVVGKDISGNNIVADLKSMPHLLIAGATGSGKSVCINTIITSFLYKARPSELKLIMIDPKVVELANYNGIPHLLTPVVTDARKASRALAIAVEEMDKRYELFAAAGVKDLESYNELMRANHEYARCKPQVVIIIDELADLMMAAPSEVENSICRLAQKARAAGMHLIVATQRPSVDVVTGLIKANVPSRIAFSVASQVDSRTILDMAGAEKLLGKGDMLFSPVGTSKPYRVQGPYISDSETDKIIKFVKKEGGSPEYDEELREAIENGEKRGGMEPQDELTEDAIAFILKSKQASVSMLQRRFRIGYNRAARIIDEIEDKGIIGPSDGSRPRQVLITEDEYYNGSSNAAAAQETLDVISPQEKAELESRLTGKPHMNLVRPANGSAASDEAVLDERAVRASERKVRKEPAEVTQRYEPIEADPEQDYERDSHHDTQETYASEETVSAAVDYFNSLPESVRRSILNSDN